MKNKLLFRMSYLGAVASMALMFNLTACGDDSSISYDGGSGDGIAVPDTVESIEVLTYNYPCTEKRKCVRTFVIDMDLDAVCDGDGGWTFGSLIEKIDCPDVENSSSSSVAKSSSSLVKSSSSSSTGGAAAHLLAMIPAYTMPQPTPLRTSATIRPTRR